MKKTAGKRQGFSLIELLTVVSVITVLIAITVPVLRQVRRQARQLVSARNQRDIVQAVTLFASDHDQQFPPSVALCRKLVGWRWQDPRKLRTTLPTPGMEHSSVSGYLMDYLEQSDRMVCPSIPEPYPYFEQAWKAGDTWDHPKTANSEDPLYGSYCLYWNYVGYQASAPFRGPTALYGGRGESQLLVTDYFGYDEFRYRGRYGSCEQARGADCTDADKLAAPYWSYPSRTASSADTPDIGLKLNAGYVDGHVEGYRPGTAERMEASDVPGGSRPYWRHDPRYPGIFFIPAVSRRQ